MKTIMTTKIKPTSIGSGVIKTLVLSAILIYIIPLYVALTNAFKPYAEIVKNPLGLPAPPILENFIRAIQKANILVLYRNSILTTFSSLFIIILISSMLAFVFSRRQTRITKILYLGILFGMMIPVQSVLIPSIQTLKFLKLLGTIPGLIFFYCGTYMSIATFLYTEFMRTIPMSLEESASIDGASRLRIFFQIIFPLLKSCSATVIIFLGMWLWNDFLPPMYVLGSSRGQTITTGIYKAIGTYTTDWSLVFAAVILASLPIVILYLLLQKNFQSGLVTGSFK